MATITLCNLLASRPSFPQRFLSSVGSHFTKNPTLCCWKSRSVLRSQCILINKNTRWLLQFLFFLALKLKNNKMLKTISKCVVYDSSFGWCLRLGAPGGQPHPLTPIVLLDLINSFFFSTRRGVGKHTVTSKCSTGDADIFPPGELSWQKRVCHYTSRMLDLIHVQRYLDVRVLLTCTYFFGLQAAALVKFWLCVESQNSCEERASHTRPLHFRICLDTVQWNV